MPNRLGGSLSPYLEQHADNPVDWYPWGDEAFLEAKRRDCPVLLSIGYSACHWCHVMAHESFESVLIAQQLNASFVSVKVDREERPDLDQIYQAVVQRMGRSGGWPLTVFLTPDRKPFFAGTYFPPVPRMGMPSFVELMDAIAEAWRDRRAELEETAAELTADVGRMVGPSERPALAMKAPERVLRRAADRLLERVDHVHGGFGGEPKFPNASSLEVLLVAAHHGDEECGAAVRQALDAMQAGGIHDQLGGGFHRYSTDARWLVPHFEKMLDQNALLLRLYAEGYRAFGDPAYRETIERTVAWIDREMTAPDGRFYASEDADSLPLDGPGPAREGVFFTFTQAELSAILPPDELTPFGLHLGVDDQGNWKEGGASACVLHRKNSVREVALALGRPEPEISALLSRAKERVLAARALRPAPFTDRKIITSWNGLLIGALAQASMALGDASLADRAARALSVYEAELGRGLPLVRACRDGARSEHGFLDDHADLASAALDVFEATSVDRFRTVSLAIVERALDLFWDEAQGVLQLAPKGAGDLIARPSDVTDQATPSGAATLAMVLLRLAAFETDERFRTIAERIALPHLDLALRFPSSHAQLLLALDRLECGSTDVLIVGDAARAEPLLSAARRAWLPRRSIFLVAPGTEGGLAERLGGHAPSEAELKDRARAYVCRGRACELPVEDALALSAQLARREVA